MINRIRSLVTGSAPAPAELPQEDHDEEVRLAAAVLLVEAAWQDESFDRNERGHIVELVRERFELNGEEAETLISAAEDSVRDATQMLPFTRLIKDRFTHEERVEMVEMLWQVVYADGVLHDHEAALMRQIGGLIYVTDQERGAARKRALARLQSRAAQGLKGQTSL